MSMRDIRHIFSPLHRYSRHEKIVEGEAPNTLDRDVHLPSDTPRTFAAPSNDNSSTNTTYNTMSVSPRSVVYPLVQNTEPRQRHQNNDFTTDTSRPTPTQHPIQQNQEEESTTSTSSHRPATPRLKKAVHFAPDSSFHSFSDIVSPSGTSSTPIGARSSGARVARRNVSASTRAPHSVSTLDPGDIKVVFPTSGQPTELEISGPSYEAALKSLIHMLPLVFMSKHVRINIDSKGMDRKVPKYDAGAISSIQRSLRNCTVQSLEWCGPRDLFSAIWGRFCTRLHSLTHLTIDFKSSVELPSLRKLIVASQYLEELHVLGQVKNGKNDSFLGAETTVQNLKVLAIKSSRVSLTKFLKSLQFDRLTCLDIGVSNRDDCTANIVTGLVEAFSVATERARDGNRQLRTIYPNLADRISIMKQLSVECEEIGWNGLEDCHPASNDWRVFLSEISDNGFAIL